MKNSPGFHTAIAFLCLSISSSAYSQDQTFELIIGGEMHDIAHDACFLENGEIIVTGAYDQDQGSGMDAFVSKINNRGETIWQTIFGYQYEDGGNEIAIAPGGNIFIAGHSDVTGTDECDALCFCLTPDGDTLWTRKFGSEGDDAAYGCITAHDGGFIAVGQTEIGIELDAFIIKYSDAGELLWSKVYGYANGADLFSSIVALPEGGYMLCGKSTENNWGNFWMMKIDEDGNKIWENNFGTGLIDVAYEIEMADDGGFILAGKSEDNSTVANIFIARTNSNGEIIWQYTYGTHPGDQAHSVSKTSSGNWVIAGSVFNILTQSTDAVLFELNDQGQVDWMKYYGDGGNDSGQRIHANDAGDLLFSGCIEMSGNENMLVMKANQFGEGCFFCI